MTSKDVGTTMVILLDFLIGGGEPFVGETRDGGVVKGDFKTSMFACEKQLPYLRFDGIVGADCGEKIVNDRVILCRNGLGLKVKDIADRG